MQRNTKEDNKEQNVIGLDWLTLIFIRVCANTHVVVNGVLPRYDNVDSLGYNPESKYASIGEQIQEIIMQGGRIFDIVH